MNLLMWLFAGAGLVFIALAIPLTRRRVKPNALYGLRVPATFADEWVWYEANARSGRDLLWLGVILTVLAVGLPALGLGIAAYIVWGLVAGSGVIATGIAGWLRANRLLEESKR